MRLSRLALALPLVVMWVSGCVPTCAETCEKWLDCGVDTERVALEECVDSCERQVALYEMWDDQTKLDAFDAHKRCVGRSSCDELVVGECYDEDIFLF